MVDHLVAHARLSGVYENLNPYLMVLAQFQRTSR